MLVVLAAGSAEAAGPRDGATPAVRTVAPGESVQAAVDAAAPGEVVELAAGTYRGSVLIAKDGITLRGPREGEAVIAPADPNDPAGAGACATGGFGVCVFGTAQKPVVGVGVESLTVTGFRKTGVKGLHADGLSVAGVRAHRNGEHGVGQEFSVRGRFVGNTTDSNGQSGVFVGDEPDGSGTSIVGNSAADNRIGVHLRRARHVTVTGNLLTANCAGVFVVGDETRPVAGDLDIVGNTMAANNRFCPGNERIAHIQGSGIVLTGTEGVRIHANTVMDHSGDSPMSGGIVMVPSFSGGGTSHQEVTGNTLLRNAPADLAQRDPRGVGNTYAANTCLKSEPADLCGPPAG
ncbi:right-handed parallel beta-helix repeat-containing protein [Streptodolium elevatio]|uniref:Right-handed parallel beta-helix repeat-containing protein n=1 Tax=Streptodolium elevatio TaxID=3157996 RepID=A0ABV3DFQ1_9ACTN